MICCWLVRLAPWVDIGIPKWSVRIGIYHFPLATMLINLLGCVLMGVAFVVISERMPSLEPYVLLVMVGFRGIYKHFRLFRWKIYLAY